MKKTTFFLIAIISIIVIYLVINNGKNNNNSLDKKENEIILLNKITPEEMLSQMTLEEKIGQMLVVGFWGTEPDYYINKMINARNIGGVILMKYNISDREQLIKLIKNLQDKSLNTSPGIPLFIAVDQEGGIVSRVEVEGVNELTAQKDITSTVQAYDVAKKRAIELKKIGINVNFSPVIDMITNKNSFLYDRVFRSNEINGVKVNTVELGHAMMKGYKQGGIIAVPKHFPGYENETDDPHEKMPMSMLLEKDLVYLQDNGSKNDSFRLRAFHYLIDEKDGRPEIIMSTPIIYKNIDSNNPAIFSKHFIKNFLRENLSYTGLIITDDMEMGALSGYTTSEAAVKAVQAGNDILLYTSTPEKQAEAYNAIVEAIKKDEININQINESVLKILRLKKANL